jgi:predicted phosphodiesterase
MTMWSVRVRMLTAFVLLAAGALLVTPVATEQEPQAPFAIVHGPYLQLATEDGVTVVWHTNRPGVSRVEYGPTAALGQQAISSHHGLIDNDRTSHVVRLTGLKPGTSYHYRVVTREFIGYEKQHIVKWGETVAGETLAIRTLDRAAGPYTFAVASDIHENAARLDTLLSQLDWASVPFVIFNGDMVNDFMNLDQPFTGFVDASVARFARRIPFVYTRGNHDVRGRYARRLSDYFPTLDGKAYYSFDHGGIHVIVLDSGEDKVDSHEYYNGLVAFDDYRKEQAAWLEQDLRSDTARRARFRVIISHIPPRGATGYSIEQVRAQWEAAANAGKADLWFSGHTHRFARLDPTPGENGYRLIVGAPDTLIRVDVTASALTTTVSREDGTVLDTSVTRQR